MTATGHYPHSLLITLVPLTFSYYIYLFHFNIIFQSTWRPDSYFLQIFRPHFLYYIPRQSCICWLDNYNMLYGKESKFWGSSLRIFCLAYCSFLCLKLNVLPSILLPNMPASLPSFSVTNQVHAHEQKEIKWPCDVFIHLIS